MKNISTFILFLLSLTTFGQEMLSLEECYALVTKNYPLAKQHALLAKQHALNLSIIETEKLPKLALEALASYQSDVTQVPIAIPNSSIEPPNKDQYRVTVSVNQLIYNGGVINASAAVKSSVLKTKQKQLEVSLYQLKKQVNQRYFSIVLLQENQRLLNSKKELITAKLKEVKAGVAYGILLPTSDKVLKVELLKIEQQSLEIHLTKKSLIETLSQLIGINLSPNISLQSPDLKPGLGVEIHRPELDMFQLQKEQIENSEQLISMQNAPKVMGFATGGYGNPGLNMLDNSFQPFYMVGLKLNWNIFDWHATKKQQESLVINKEIITNETEIFKLNTNIELNQQQSEIDRIAAFIQSDKSIIDLRKQLLKSAESQLKNGVITAAEFLTELTNLYEAENNLSTHKIQLLFAKATYKITRGN